MVAPDTASENGGNLLEALVSGQFREGCVHHCDRLLDCGDLSVMYAAALEHVRAMADSET
jgi:hypothetical protein